MAQPPVSIKLTVPPRQGRPSLVQIPSANPTLVSPSVIQHASPAFKPFTTLRPFVSNTLGLPVNTNTATQYIRKPAETTVISSGNAFVSGPLGGQPFTLYSGAVMAINPNMMQPLTSQSGMPNPGNQLSQLNGPSTIMSSMANSRKPCNCTKSHCLKLYCECFAQGQLCQNCNCHNCMNNLAYEEERGRAIKMTLERNPTAFHPKIGRGEGERKHTKGCNCKRSGCLKNYCECYEAKISCSDLCRCQGCRNTEDSVERRSLMRLAAMGSLRSRQPAAFKKHLIKPPPETLPHVFFTWEVIEATTSCLIAQAEEAERHDLAPAAQERIVLEEFGRILEHVIDCASKAQVRSGGSLHGQDSDGDQSILHSGAPVHSGYAGRSGASAVGVATAAEAAADVLLRNDEDEDLMRQIDEDDDDDEDDQDPEIDDEDMFDDSQIVVPPHHHQMHRTARQSVSRRTNALSDRSGAVPDLLDDDMMSDDDLDVIPDTTRHPGLMPHKYRSAATTAMQSRSRSHMSDSHYHHQQHHIPHTRRSARTSHHDHDPDSMI